MSEIAKTCATMAAARATGNRARYDEEQGRITVTSLVDGSVLPVAGDVMVLDGVDDGSIVKVHLHDGMVHHVEPDPVTTAADEICNR